MALHTTQFVPDPSLPGFPDLKEFQWLTHLPVTGRLDSATQHQMAVPRCGVRDDRGQQAWAQRVNSIFNGGLTKPNSGQRLRRKRHSQLAGRWHKHHLTYRVVNWPGHLPRGQVALAARKAFQLWSNVSALTFREVIQGSADIRLAFYKGEHNDGMGNAFDGPGGALAHAFFPCRGEAHFDMAERWTLNGYKGHNLFMVIAHEVGHTLGLEHSPVRHALMSPYYKKLGKATVLSWDDITAVQQLYGKPESGQVIQLPGQVFSSALQDWELSEGGTAKPDSTPPPYCRGFFDAITMDQDGTILVFRGGLFWTASPAGQASSPLPLQNRWPGLPLAIEAAAYSKMDNKFHFFKGSLHVKTQVAALQFHISHHKHLSTFLLASLPPGRRVWLYSSSGMDPGFPLRSSELGLPGHPDQAFYYPHLGHLVVFKGQRYFVLNLGTLRPEPYYPCSLEDWRGVPQGANGALSHPDGQVYFFKEQQYWSFDPEKVQVTGGGRWDIVLEWTGCLGTHHRGNDIL
ncbi:matrix metalloproteinase-28-like [Coregonus clupeaformis]|uniref:matrix metalloproteinase-28-like n=1 Tax=Coregonus clupeaformis TaxID=59861 RepID=UPI001E1C5AEC|nr:matrix metalloproteinase-28-like [Coregonus clupeaformis]